MKGLHGPSSLALRRSPTLIDAARHRSRRRLITALALNELRGLACASLAALALCHAPQAHAQNSPLTGLAPRGTVQSTDIIPIMPAGGSQLMQTTVAAIIAPATPGGGTGTVQAVNLTVPGFSCATTGTATLTITCSLGAGASSTTFLRGDGTWATPAGTAPSGTANQVYATPNGSSGTASLRAMVIPDLPASGVTAGSYSSPVSVTVNTAGQVTGIVGGQCLSGCTTLNIANFTWVNQGTSTAVQPITGGPIGLFIPDDGGTCCTWRGFVQSVPASTPWKVIIAFNASAPLPGAVSFPGMMVFDGTKLIVWELGLVAAGFQPQIEHVPSVSSGGTPVFTATAGWAMFNAFQRIAYLQIRDDGTNLYFDNSPDGVVFYNHYSEAVGAYLTPTKIGVMMLQQQNSAVPGYLGILNFQAYADANLNGP